MFKFSLSIAAMTSEEPLDTPGFLSRYFLRRLAAARRNPNNSTLGVSYIQALGETVLVWVCLPAMSLFSFVVIASSKRSWLLERWYFYAPRAEIVGLVVLSMAVGYTWGHSKFKVYYADPSPSKEFDSDEDRWIIFWQKFCAFFILGIGVPGIALLCFVL
jgi:hypothetical protein